jgi:hypothetical protein
MSMVIDVDFKLRWAVPVHVRIMDGSRVQIDGPEAALLAMRYRWPPTESPKSRLARDRCIRALSQNGSVALARESFVDAAVDAKVLA